MQFYMYELVMKKRKNIARAPDAGALSSCRPRRTFLALSGATDVRSVLVEIRNEH